MTKQMRRIVFACLVALILIAGVIWLASCKQDEPVAVNAQRLEPVLFQFHENVVTNTNGSVMDLTQLSNVAVQVKGLGSATVMFSVTVDGSTWVAAEAVNRSTGAKTTSTAADGIFDVAVSFAELRCPISSWVSDAITVTAIGKDGGVAPPADVEVSDILTGTVSVVQIENALPTGGNNIGKVGLEDADGDEAEIGPNGSLAVKQLLLDIDQAETVTGVGGSTDVSGISTDTSHRGRGANSIEFDKDGTSEAFAVISRTISTVNAVDWARHSFIDYWVRVTDGQQSTIDSVRLALGTDSGNNWYWETSGDDINDGGWTHVRHALGTVDGEAGVGADWSSITWWSLTVTLDATGNTLTDFRIDDILLERASSAYVRDVDEAGYSQTVDTELAAAAALADAAANPTIPKVGAAELLYNDTTWDRERNNTEGTLLASAAYTTTTSSADTINYNSSALALFVDVTSISASPSVTAQLDWKDPVSGDYEPIWIATVAIVGTGEYIYLFDLGGLGSAGEYDEAVNIRIPRTFRLTMTHADADSITYSVGLALMQ